MVNRFINVYRRAVISMRNMSPRIWASFKVDHAGVQRTCGLTLAYVDGSIFRFSPTVFPRSKHRFAPPGQRKFVFINLWDEHQKGAETAKHIAQACPDYEFSVIAGIPIHLPNCRNYTWIGSTTPRYRHLISQADFVVCPGREDPQPGTVAEACSLGLLPILSYGSGYVLSFPQMLDVDNIDQCVSVLKAAQQASAEEIALWQTISARYIEAYHRPDYFENLLLYYLREAITEIKSHQV